jgi:ketosteroid isomerase-like protein
VTDVNASAAVAAFMRYTRAFQSRDSKAVVDYFDEPALMVTPQGVHALPNAAAVEEMYTRVMADMPKDYAHTEFSRIEERHLSEDLSAVTGSGRWVDTAGNTLMSFGMTYTFRRTGSGWRIVVAIIHDANAK